MRVLLISANREDVDMRVTALGLACVATAVQDAGHETRLLDLMLTREPENAVAQAIQEFSPEIIGLSVRNIDDQRMRNTRFLLDQARDAVRWCRRSTGAPIVAGGAGFSILPQPILDYLDLEMGIQGEGEGVFPELLKRIEAGGKIDDLPGVWLKGRDSCARRAFSKSLDQFRLPDPALLAPSLSGAKDAPVPVQTRRGCPLRCSYCSTPTIEGRQVCRRSPETVIAWLSSWVKVGFRNFYFVDNTFNLPPSYAMHLCSGIIEAGLDISWRCILYPGGLDESLIKTLARAGCVEASLGFETGALSVLQSMRKDFSLESVRHAASLLRRYGIRTMGFLLLGGPGESKESAVESLKFADSLNLDSMKVSVGIRIYPHTELARTAELEGIIASERDLLFPKFYLAAELQDWLPETAAEYVSARPTWTL